MCLRHYWKVNMNSWDKFETAFASKLEMQLCYCGDGMGGGGGVLMVYNSAILTSETYTGNAGREYAMQII